MLRRIILIITMTLVLAVLGCSPGHARAPSADPDELVGAPQGAAAQASSSPSRTGEPAVIRRGALWYRIVHDGSRLLLTVRLLRPASRTSFFLPGRWATRDDYAQSIRVLGASGPQGPLAWTLHREQGRIDVHTGESDWVDLDYEVLLHVRRDEAMRFHPHFLGRGFFAYAPTILILPSEEIASTLRQIPVELRTPASWRVVSTWGKSRSMESRHEKGQRVHGFVLEDINALRDAFLATSEKLVVHTPEARSPRPDLTVAFEKDFRGQRDAIWILIDRIVSTYREEFGQLSPITVLVRSPPGKPSSPWGTGRKSGFLLEIEHEARVSRELKILIAHEAFHLWNGHEVIPSPQQEPATRWFKEGATQYVALRTLVRMGLLEQRSALDEIAQAAHRYSHHPRTKGSPSTPEQALQYPYDRGLLLALFLDSALRPQGGLTAWFLRILKRTRQSTGWTYDLESLESELPQTDERSPQLENLWTHHIEKQAPLPLGALFESLGLHWLDAEPGRRAKLIPLQSRSSRYRTLLSKPTQP